MKRKFSLLTQLTLILLLFVGAVLGLIYVFQTAFLDDFYSKEKIETLNIIAKDVETDLLKGDRDDVYNDFGMSNEVCIRIVSNSERYTYTSGCFLKDMSVDTVNQVAQDTITEGGEKMFKDFKYVSPKSKHIDDLYLYSRYLKIDENNVALIMVSSIITPLDVTVKTLKSQYGIIVLIVILMTLFLAAIISMLVIQPLNRINNESKKLARGGYDHSNIKSLSLEFEELNETLNVANEDIQIADKTRKELLANVSHDLRTPLTMIVGYGEMMRDIPEENNEENISVIINEAQRLSELVNDILLISKMEAGQIELHKQPVRVKELLNEVYHQYEKYCESRNTRLILSISNDISFMGDKSRLEQVLYNFMNNALNYNDKKEAVIEIGVTKMSDTYRIYVKDNGEGIDEKDLDKIWERYYKVDKQHRRFNIGSGIGLSVCKQILIAHEFNYGVDSRKGEFSQFYFDVHEC